MTSFILRKRAIEFSDDDDDNSQGIYLSLPIAAIFEIARRLAEGGSEENDDDSASQKQDRLRAIRATFLSSLPTPSSSSVSSPTSSPPAGLPTSHETMTSITPPRTPTRRSTRQLHLQEPSTALTSVKGTRRSESKKTENNRGGEENDDSENTAPEDISPVGLTPSKKKTQSVPVTPPKAMMRSTSSSNLGNNSLTTGLTPAMNRMLKPSKAILEENAKSRRARAATVTTASSSSNPFLNSADQEDSENIDVNRIQGYSTPKRLQRTKSMVNENRGPMNNNAAGPATLKRHMTDASLAASSSSSASSSANSAPASKMLGYYQEAKTLFRRTTEPNRLVGRAAERETIRKFCEEHVLTTKSGSLYISGQPGTGKTALLKEVMRDMEPEMETLDHEVKTVTINCMAIQDPKLVYVKLLEEMRLSADSKSKEGAVKMLEKLFLGTGKNKTML
ncbi:AAA ATPase [Lunasporangiospora selenospora]|uniref:AAA ATPase n=1 Tax=Lunasporangiospora selenospora TaxID=979761 RepID=A0A9P6G4F8_9FUNG|nr:AAA ATPase [Lunasporangiospora selenospora]